VKGVDRMRKPEYDDACFWCEEDNCLGCPVKEKHAEPEDD